MHTDNWPQVEYPDIKPKFDQVYAPSPSLPIPSPPLTQSRSLEPNKDAPFPYTIPIIRLPSGKYLMDSAVIARTLEAEYPTPTLHVDSPEHTKLQATLLRAATALRPEFFHRLPSRLLAARSQEYFEQTRRQMTGLSTAEYQDAQGGDPAYEAAAPHLREITDMYRATPGTWVMGGDGPSYADFVWISFLVFYKTIGEDVFGRVLDATGDRGMHLRLLEEAEPYTRRNN